MSNMGIQERILQPFFGKKKYSKFWRKVYKATLRGMNVGNGAGFDESGERYAIQYVKDRIARTDTPVLFDVGANRGGYVNELLKYWGQKVAIHCFEPVPQTFQILSENVTAPNVILNNFGISDTISEGIIYYNDSCDGLASLFDRQCVEGATEELVRLDTLEHYCAERNVPYIDFLKMDIEGNELNALKGAEPLLRQKKIGAIQIEFGGCNIDSRTYFRDFWNLLHEDYVVYRVLLDGLYEIEAYDEVLEIFSCTNYLFVSKSLAK